MEHRIRPFAPEDLPQLHEIRKAAFAPVFQSFADIVGPDIAPVAFAGAEKEQAALLDRLCAPDSASDVAVAEANGKIVGFCAHSCDADSKIGEIELNAVSPEHQARGLGAALFDHAVARMRDAGMKVATVGVGGDPSHAAARKAYDKAGFKHAIPSVWLYRTL